MVSKGLIRTRGMCFVELCLASLFCVLSSGAVIADPVEIAELLTEIRGSSAIEAKSALVKSAQADLDVLKSLDSPKVTIDAQGPFVGGDRTQRDYTMLVEQSLYDWGANDQRMISAGSYVNARDLEKERAVIELSVRVSESFHLLAKSFLQLGVHVNARESVGELVDMMARRVDQSISPKVDLDIVRSRLALINVKIEQLYREIQRQKLAILRSTKIAVETPDIEGCSLDEQLDEPLLVRIILDSSPALKMHDATLSALSTGIEALRSDVYPKIVGGYRVDADAGGDNFDQQAYVALRLEMQTGGNLDSRIAVERARVLERRALREQETELAVQQASDLISQYLTARNLVSIQKTLAEARRQQKDSYLRRFVAGRASWADVLNVDGDLVEARSAQVAALADACGALSSLSILAGTGGSYAVQQTENER